jgi:hypothetical protein
MGERKIMSYEDWLKIGLLQGWCGPSVCETHDGVPMSQTEIDAYEDGEDPCVHILRLYEDAEQKAAVEEAHSPSIWRATNSGYEI